MKSRALFASSLLATILGAMPFSASRAGTVLYDEASFVQGQQSFTQSFNITGPGTLTVSVAEIPWLDIVSDLNCFLSSSKDLISPATNSGGSETFSVGGGPIYAHWFGSALGIYDLGVIGVKISFQPTAMPVPLPASLVLLLSGLGVLFGWQRRPLTLAAGPSAVAA
jgi:hypothetical protein